MDASRHPGSWNPVQHYQDGAVAESYDRERFSCFAGRVFNRLDKRTVRRALEGLAPGSVVADIPCGTGRLAEVALEMGYEVCGIDISPAMLEMARNRLARFGARFTARVADIRALQAAGQSFDAVLSARFLMHFPLDEQRQLIRGLARLAGRRLVLTHGIDTAWHRLRRDFKSRFEYFWNPAAFPVSEAELASMLREAGFAERGRHYVLPFLSEAVAIVAEPNGGEMP
ncbi:MAG: methyltransferase domain-containing protein [Stellaceae bacterium]|jgi:2-polyprenyl-3-methyl-5-hydroxy-6-metoxy-1,4-benzoquinol methylase